MITTHTHAHTLKWWPLLLLITINNLSLVSELVREKEREREREREGKKEIYDPEWSNWSNKKVTLCKNACKSWLENALHIVWSNEVYNIILHK